MSFLRANLVRSLRRGSSSVYIMSSPKNRLAQITTSLEKGSASKELLGELKLGGISLPIYTSDYPDRLVKSDSLLDLSDPTVSFPYYSISFLLPYILSLNIDTFLFLAECRQFILDPTEIHLRSRYLFVWASWSVCSTISFNLLFDD